MDVNFNFLAVLAATAASMVLGYLWYGPLFGKPWMKLSGITLEKINASKGDMPKIYGMQALGALVTAYVLKTLLNLTFPNMGPLGTFAPGVMLGFWVWLGFVAPVMMSSVLYEGKPLKLYLINAGYYLVSLLVMGGVLAYWV